MVACGSSPRLRGTARMQRERRYSARFIPAPAGNRPERHHRTALEPVHPRACGEQPRVKPGTGISDGSSPRLRGTDFPKVQMNGGLRFIPAPAGNRAWSALPGRSLPVHPRACGEQFKSPYHRFAESGSSPAPAGNRSPPEPPQLSVPVHPRACGEQSSTGWCGTHQRRFIPAPAGKQGRLSANTTRYVGSSPRLRGTGWPYSP